MKKQYFTIYLGDKLWQSVTDDMNSEFEWSKSGRMWDNKEDATKSLMDLKESLNHFETKQKVFNIREVYV